MSDIICHHKGKYNLYCTCSDGFYFSEAITLGDLKSYLRSEAINRAIREYERDIPQRLERAHKQGHSHRRNQTLEDFMCVNRAGDDEAHVSIEHIIENFLS